MRRVRRARAPLPVLVVLAVAIPACSPPSGPSGGGGGGGSSTLPAAPVPITPMAGATVTVDRPTFTVQNARGYDSGQATYTFELATGSGTKVLATTSAPAGSGTTSATFADALPRGLSLSWRALARNATGEVASDRVVFQPAAVDCAGAGNRYAKAVVESFLTECSLRHNSYNDPDEVLGAPDAGRLTNAPFVGYGFMSLGEKGHVTVDMERCALDTPGPDIRVWQTVSVEPVTLYVAGQPQGPFILVGDRVRCGTREPGGPFSGYCEFDLADAEIREARYLRVEDGEHYPCEQADTDSEGADLDAVQILHLKP